MKVKSTEHAHNLRESGNAAFRDALKIARPQPLLPPSDTSYEFNTGPPERAAKIVEACRLYSESLRFSPAMGTGRLDMMLTLANRSAALFDLGLWNACLADIAECLKTSNGARSNVRSNPSLPQLTRLKLLRRRVDCLQQLRSGGPLLREFRCRVDDEVNTALFKLENGDESVVMDALAEYNAAAKQCDVTLTGNVISADMRVPFRSTDWPAVARDELGPVTCCYNETWTDRSLHATDALKPGDLVLRELPALIALLPTMSAQRCDECGTLLPLNPVCCDHCVTPFFCSIKCKLKSVHSKVCNQTHTLDGLDSEWLLSIKLLSASNTWRRRPSRVLDVSQSTLTLSVEDALARLQGHESKMPRSKRASLAKAASSLVSLHSLPFAHPVLVGALCKVRCNCFAIKTQNLDVQEESSLLGEQQGEIGKGLFLKAAHLNHSCEPNAVAMFDPTNCQIVVKVTRPLLAMDEILISYGPTASRMKCVERRRLLLEKWSFNCECAACHAPDLACLYTNAFPCTSANCPWPVQIEDSACSVCLSPAVIDVQGFNASCSLFESALQAVGERKLSLLAKVEVLRTRLCHPTSFQLACLYDAMGKELAEQGVFDLASKYVLRAVKIIEKIYGVAGVEMAKERLKLAELFYLAGKVARARVWASRALEMRWLLSDSEIAATLPMLTASADQ